MQEAKESVLTIHAVEDKEKQHRHSGIYKLLEKTAVVVINFGVFIYFIFDHWT